MLFVVFCLSFVVYCSLLFVAVVVVVGGGVGVVVVGFRLCRCFCWR